MAEEREERIKQLKQKLTLTEVSLTNATNNLKSGKVVKASDIDDLITSQDALKKEIEDLNNPLSPFTKGELKLTSDPEPLTQSDNYGIPKHLRIKRRKYTMSPEAVEQRKKAASSPKLAEAMKGNNNAWKHGQYAQTFLKQVFSPCLSTCKDYPCSLVGEGKTDAGDLCLDKVEIAEGLRALSKAVQEGDLKEWKDIAAVRLGGLDAVLKMLIEDVTNENTVVKSEMFGKDGQRLGWKIVPHPSLNYIAELARTLGYSFDQFLATPLILKKTESEAKAAESLSNIMGRAAAAAAKAQEKKKGTK